MRRAWYLLPRERVGDKRTDRLCFFLSSPWLPRRSRWDSHSCCAFTISTSRSTLIERAC